MQLSQLIRITDIRWAGVFGGVAGAIAATVVRRQLSTLSSGRAALAVGLLAAVFVLLLVVITNLTGVMPADTRGDDAVGNE